MPDDARSPAAGGSSAEVRDETLLLRAARDDRAAFEQLVGRYRIRLYNYLLKLVGNPADAEDLFQETWVRVYRKRKEYKAQGHFRTWLYTIATNLARDEFRRRKRKFAFSLQQSDDEDDGLQLEDRVGARQPGAAQLAREQEALRQVRDAIDTLPAEQRETLLLSFFEQLGHAEIAEIQDCSVGTVKSRLSRARQKLHEQLGGLLDELAEARQRGE